jgi:hypothetical protein
MAMKHSNQPHTANNKFRVLFLSELPPIPTAADNQSKPVLPNIPFPTRGSSSPLPARPDSRIVLSVGGMGKAVQDP